jgi:ribonucleoside-diphosphate reductase alpha chain
VTRYPNAKEGKPGVYIALSESGETMRRGGGIGYDFFAICLKDTKIKGTASSATDLCG